MPPIMDGQPLMKKGRKGGGVISLYEVRAVTTAYCILVCEKLVPGEPELLGKNMFQCL